MTTWLEDPVVAVVRERPSYARTPPFPPSEILPEWPGQEPGTEDNPGYRAVRLALHRMGLDQARFGSPAWDPLGDLLHPGETAVLKPNLVFHRNTGGPKCRDTECLVTHGSIVRATVDYAAKALRGRGRIVVGDCPIQGASWSALMDLVGLDTVLADAARRFPGVDFQSRDYRLTRARMVGNQVVSRESTTPDPDRYLELDVGHDSLLLPLMSGPFAFGVAQYPRHRMRRTHTPDSNRYLIPRELLEADLFINLPKMKSHQKAGITCALKNLVGVNGHKDYLPHFRFGSPKQGGDEYPDGGVAWDVYWRLVHGDWELDRGLRKLLLQAGAFGWGQVLRRLLRVPRSAFARAGGSWHGNDTLWRTVLDINRAFLYFDREAGTVGSRPARRYLSILDGLVAGERESPLSPSPVPAGWVLAGRNPLALDTVAAALMGLDWKKLPQVARAYGLERLPLAGFGVEEVALRGPPELACVDDVYQRRAFTRCHPSVGWAGHVECHAVEPRLEPAPREAVE